MTKWKKFKLAEVINIISGGTPKTSVSDYWNGNIPWLSVKDFRNDEKYVYVSEKTITQKGFDNSTTNLLTRGDIIISARGTVGELAMIPYDMAFNQSCYGLRAKNNFLLNDFLYYLLKNNIKIMQTKTHGTTFGSITIDTFNQIEANLPPLETQKKIAAVLGALDDKIELNNRINENLLELALSIYKAWFCDYIFSNGVRPETWKITTINDVSSLITRGITPKYDDESDQIVINQKCIRNNYIDLSFARRHFPKKISEKWIQKGDLLINSKGIGTLGRTAQVWFDTTNNITVDSNVTIVRPKEPLLQSYIGFWGLSHENEIEALHTGSTGQTELPRESVKLMEFPLPDNESLRKFNELIIPITHTIIFNKEENFRLSQFRDSLLPKLMSGEIDVSAVRI